MDAPVKKARPAPATGPRARPGRPPNDAAEGATAAERAFFAAVLAYSRAGAGEAASAAALAVAPRAHRFALRGRLDRFFRHHARLGWLLARQGESATPESMAAAALVLFDKVEPEIAARLASTGAGQARRLTTALVRLREGGLRHPEMPEAVRLECPPEMLPLFAAAFGARMGEELAALTRAAPVDLRANRLKATRDALDAELRAEGIVTDPLRAPDALRAKGRPDIPSSAAFLAGLCEIQDEGSQIVAALVGARPGRQVLDFCAGAGGKSLALAAAMANRGHLVAADVSEKRLARAKLRMKRAGVENAERVLLTGTDEDPFLTAQAGHFDRVLVDAPCSGTGAWRRHPEIRWKGLDLDRLTGLQDAIFARASRLVKPGGHLVYATCSLLPAENEGRAAAFLAGHPEFRAVPAAEAWAEATGAQWPFGDADHLSLSPARDGTDGFFAAVFERRR